MPFSRCTPTTWLGAAAMLVALGRPAFAQDYRITVDGSPLASAFVPDGNVVSIAGEPSPWPGDLVWLAPDVLVRLGEPGLYEFTDQRAEQGRLLLRYDGAESTAVLDSHRLVAADAATCEQLCGVLVVHWTVDVATAIARLDPGVPVVVADSAALGERRALPPLPAATRHLALAYDTAGFDDLSAALALEQLRSLHVVGRTIGFSVDLAPFAGATELRAFEHCQRGIETPATIARWRELRSFAARGVGVDFELLGELRELRRVACHGPVDSAPRSLAPLATLPHLASIRMVITPIGELPTEGFEALRELHLHGCRLPVAQQRAFRRAHPKCSVGGGVDAEQLRDVLRTADRLVVRTGGTCHTNPADEESLFETTDPSVVATVAALLRVDELARGYHCMCCGDPTLVFWAGSDVAATLGLHHGASVRWADGPWLGDGRLAPGAGKALEQWLATHCASRHEARAQRATFGAWRHRARCRAAALAVEPLADGDLATREAAWRRALCVTESELVTLLRLLGCHEGAWNAIDAFDRALLDHADERAFPESTWARLDAAARDDARIARGLAAWWADQRAAAVWPPRYRNELLPLVADAGLRHPQRWNRARTLQRLRDDPSPRATDLLLAALAGEPTPRRVVLHDLDLVGHVVGPARHDLVLASSGASVPALAALCLAQRGHSAALPAIRELAAAARGGDRIVFARAIAELVGK